VVVVHHKNALRHKWWPLEFTLPPEAVECYKEHIEWGHALVNSRHYLFCTPTGQVVGTWVCVL
jgi:hypothetical protein